MFAASVAASAIHSGMARFDASAAKVASNSAADPADQAVEQMSAKQDVQANVAVLRAALDVESTFERFA